MRLNSKLRIRKVIAAALFGFGLGQTALAREVCSTQLKLSLRLEDHWFDAVSDPDEIPPGMMRPGDLHASVLTGEDCSMKACLRLSKSQTGVEAPQRLCLIYQEGNIRGGLKFFTDVFSVKLDPVQLDRHERRVMSISELGLLEDGSLTSIVESPEKFLRSISNSIGNRLTAIQAEVDEPLSRNARAAGQKPKGFGEATVIRYNPVAEAWHRVSCFEMSGSNTVPILDLTLNVVRQTKFVETCPK
jgi:hypothetical protein